MSHWPLPIFDSDDFFGSDNLDYQRTPVTSDVEVPDGRMYFTELGKKIRSIGNVNIAVPSGGNPDLVASAL